MKETLFLINLNKTLSTQKIVALSELKKSSKKHKLNNTLGDNIINNQMSSKINDINSSTKNFSIPLRTSTQTNDELSLTKFIFTDKIINDNIYLAINNLNYLRQDRIFLNEFDLELIYEKKEFHFKINKDIVTSNSEKLEFKSIIFPNEKHADQLLMIVMNIFSNPMNCGYFLKNELNSIFLLFTLSQESQMLFVRLLKRKLVWHRMRNLKYPEIANNLYPFFKELIQNELCVSDLVTTDISVLLNMLQIKELRSICKKLKINHRENKIVLINKLLKYGNISKSFFVGAKSPKSVLRSMVLSILEPCICLPENIINLFYRILTLLHPIQDPSESIADLFFTLTNVQKREFIFPPILKKEAFPIFKNRLHLIDFVKNKNILRDVLKFIEKKEWNEVRTLGRLALKHLLKAQIMKEKSSLPSHVKKFIPEYLWIKILIKSVEAFKKTPETINEAIIILKILINEKHFILHSQGRWYSELALIEMYHRKDLESTAALILDALQQNTLTEVDKSNLIERLKKLMSRKTGISKKTKVDIQKVQEKIANNILTPQFITTKTITAKMANRIRYGGKSTWSVNINDNNKYYGSVEMLTLQYYISKENFQEGLHCEGLLTVTLFTVCFWDELYNTFIPGVFVSPFQDAPLDLFTDAFFSNRRKSIEDKIKFLHKLDLESFSDWMEKRYSNYNQYRSTMSNTLFKSSQQFKELITCLGIDGVIGICEKLVSNFRLWRSGFPDLIVWNALIFKCKIIEVKGPGDFLSEKQKLWLQFLKKLGIEIEVCHVEVTTNWKYSDRLMNFSCLLKD